MGAWAYCGCGLSFDVPTTKEIILGAQECSCGESRHVDSYLKTELLVEMHEEIAELKTKVDKLVLALGKVSSIAVAAERRRLRKKASYRS